MLSGYFQSEKYFRKYKEDIKNLIKTESTDEFKAKYNFDINSTVIIHARRTDYIEHANFHGPLKINYYINSIKLMKEKLNKDKLTFLLISDDNNFLKYLQENISDLRGSIIINDNDINTFQLMYQMKYFIIANSSFSWWGAWLAPHEIVIAPKNWFGEMGPKDTEDIYLDSWLRC